MAMRKAFTGGACAPGGEGQTMGNNAMTNMMDYMISGGASASQKAEGFGPQMDGAHMSAMEAAFANQERLDAMNKQFEQLNVGGPQMMQAPHPVQEHSAAGFAQMNDLWNKPLETVGDMSGKMGEDIFSEMPSNHPNIMAAPGQGVQCPYTGRTYYMPPSYMPPQMAAMPREVVKVEEAKEEAKEEVKKETKQMSRDEMNETTAQLIRELEKIPSDKIQSSEFLSFLKKLNTGAYKIEDNGLQVDPEKSKEFDQKLENQRKMDAAYYQAKIDEIVEETKDPERFFKEEDAIKQKGWGEDLNHEFDPVNLFKDVWEGGELDESQLQQMMANWKAQAEKSMGYYNETMEIPPVETVIQVPKEDFFAFEKENPYAEIDDAYTLACKLNDELKVHDAVLALKAHLTKNPDHAPSWRLLGQLYQEKDEDERAIAYFKKAYDLDPYDLDSLLCLGVSCTNELNERVAMNYLVDWLRYNPEYCDLPIPDDTITDIDQLRKALKETFQQANEKNPDDVEVLVCLGVIAFGEREYNLAAEYFGAAAHENPNDYNLWNKYGAALANFLSTEKALAVYDHTLKLRPSLVRTWANVGIAYCNKDMYRQAAGKFLNAIALNPTADHLWKYLHSCFWALKEFDKCEMVKKRNIELFRGEFNIINPDALEKE